VGAAAFGATHLARIGTQRARLGAAALVVTSVVAVIAVALVRRRRWSDARRAIQVAVGAIDPALAGAIARASSLVESGDAKRPAAGDRAGKKASTREARPEGGEETPTARRGVSSKSVPPETLELAELHLSRQLSRISIARATEGAETTGRRFALAAVAFAAAGVALAAVEPVRVLEGALVLAARHGQAPAGLVYLDDVDIVATRPPYLQEPAVELDDFGPSKEPRGTVIAVRGRPTHPGRKLVLTDGVAEEAFADDGNGMLVARWTLGDSTAIHVAARFGEVQIPQRDTLELETIPDLAPVVSLEGAPKTVKLIDTPSVPLRYEVKDDHGLKEIQLVLRSGGKEDRRTLSRPSSDTKVERGGQELSTREPFFQKSYVPVEVTIEARDNDGVLGPKWGRSPAIVVIPPEVGEPEALRYAALLQIRDALVDLAAPRVERLARAKAKSEKAAPADAKSAAVEDAKAQRAALDRVEELLSGTYGGLSIRGRARSVVAGQTRRLAAALDKAQASPTDREREALAKATEDAVLAVDSAVRAQGFGDSAKVSKRLAEVADEVAAAAHAWGERPSDRASADLRLDAAIGVLRGGGEELAKLGDLGADLGDIVRGGIGRIARPRQELDLVSAEIAARDLAERLRHPEGSIGGGGQPGVESGGAPSGGGSAGEDGEGASDAAERAEGDGKELDELIKEHAEQIGKVADAMRKATTDEEREALKKLAKEQADAIREAVKSLPDQGIPGTPSEKAAEGRKHAESMAGALEQGDAEEAVKAGEEALKALREAQRRGSESSFSDEQEAAKDATRAGNRVEEALDAMKDALKKMKDAAEERAKQDLKDAGADEKRMAERTRELGKRGEKGDSSMPDDVLEKLSEAERAMRDAEEALEQGDAERGASKQKDAQRLLEMAKGDDDDDKPSDDKGDKGGEDGDGKRLAQKVPVPGKDKHKDPESFRKRVTEGLGMAQDPRLREAIKRYAEGLLR
jgi:hypothetical protein